MPELPEVETIANDLQRVLRGQEFVKIERRGQSRAFHSDLPVLRRTLIGQKIRRVFRRAKMVVVDCGEAFLLIHLKMTGQLIYTRGRAVVAGGHPIASTGVTVPNKYTLAVFHLSGGGVVYFNDVRKFGWLKVMTPDEFAALDEAAGLEPLAAEFTIAYFSALLVRRAKTTIKAALLDQTRLVGLGNIYVDEILFRAKVKPFRRAGELSAAEVKRIWQSIPVILKQAIKQRGTTFKDYRSPDGLVGGFVSQLKVYGRADRPCRICGEPIRKRSVAGRGTHWCDQCQH